MTVLFEKTRWNATAEKMKSGDKEAAGKIFDHFSPLIYRYFMGKTLNRPVSEDLTQDVFLKVIDKIGTFDKKTGNFTAWIWKIAKNRLIDHYREKKSVPLYEFMIEGDEPSAGPETIHKKILAEDISRAVKSLKPEEQEIFSLYYFADLPYKEISRLTEKTEGALRILIHRTNNKLKKILR